MSGVVEQLPTHGYHFRLHLTNVLEAVHVQGVRPTVLLVNLPEFLKLFCYAEWPRFKFPSKPNYSIYATYSEYSTLVHVHINCICSLVTTRRLQSEVNSGKPQTVKTKIKTQSLNKFDIPKLSINPTQSQNRIK